jgi:hypothetical protein
MSIKSIADIANSNIVEFESVSETEGSAFMSTSNFRDTIKNSRKIFKFLERNGFKHTHPVSHYGSVGGTWENKETSASFQVIIRYGDMVIVREG